MSNIEFKLNTKGVGELLKSPEMQSYVEEIAYQHVPGDGYDVKSFVGFDRARAHVIISSESALNDNLDNNTLLKEIGA